MSGRASGHQRDALGRRGEGIGPVPFRLDEGVLLEDSGSLIPWGAALTDLAGFEGPVVERNPGSFHLSWLGRICLGGLPCRVGAIRIDGTPNPRAYHIYLEHFHFCSLDIGEVAAGGSADIEHGFRRNFRHLERYLGGPSFSYPGYDDESGLPAIFWEYPRLMIGYVPTSRGKLGTVTITQEPDGHEALKAEARAIRTREGEGARINHVAWPLP